MGSNPTPSARRPISASLRQFHPIAESAQNLPYGEALRVKENYLALLRRLAYEERGGALIDLATAEAVLFDCFRSQRDAWLNWPVKAASLIANALGFADIDQVAAILAKEIHRQLAELGEPQANFPSGNAAGTRLRMAIERRGASLRTRVTRGVAI